jgi:uncharacterized protein
MQTCTGRLFYPCDPDPIEVDIVDIAHSLATPSRYAGHGRIPYSVAQHSVLVSAECPEHALLGLLHDAAEAYCQDLIAPIKRWPPIAEAYRPIEQACHRAVMAHFGLPFEIPEDVQLADNRLRATELRDVMGGATARDCIGDPFGYTIEIWPWDMAERSFLTLFKILTR